MPIGTAIDKSKEISLDWRRYKTSRLMISDHYFKLGLVVVIVESLLEKQYEVDLIARMSHQFFCLQDRTLWLSTRDERMGFSSDLMTHAQTSLQLLNLIFSIPIGAVDPEMCVRNRNRREEIFWPAPLSEMESAYLYPWTSQKGLMPSTLLFQTYVTVGDVFAWNLEGIINESEMRVPLMKYDFPLVEKQVITGIVALSERAPYEVFLLKSLWQFSAFLGSSSVMGEPIELVYHLPYYDRILFGVGLFLSNKITLPALGSLFKCILDKRMEHIAAIHHILLGSELKCELNYMVESPFVNIFGPIEDLLESTHWDDKRKDLSELALAILSHLDIPSSIYREDPSERERFFVRRCKQRLLERYEHTQANAFYRALRHAWSDYGLDDIHTLEDLLRLGASLMISASAYGKEGVKVCSWLLMSEQESAERYDRSLVRLNRSNTRDSGEGKIHEEEPYPAIMNLVLLEPAVYSPTNITGDLFRFRESCQKFFVKLVDKGLLEMAMVNALTFSEGKKHGDSLKDAFSSRSMDYFGHPEATKTLSDPSLDLLSRRPLKKIPFMAFCTFFPWISPESETIPYKMSSKDKVRFLLWSRKKEVLVSSHFKFPREFNNPGASDPVDDALQYQLLTATFHKGHLSAMRFIRNATHAKKAAITFDTTPPLLSLSLSMLAMLPEEYSCRKIFLDHILKNAKDLVSKTLVELVLGNHLTFEEANELIQELLQATSQLTPFFTLFFCDKVSLSNNLFVKFLALAMEGNLTKSAAALNVIYANKFLSANTLIDMIKKRPKCDWRILVVSMLIQYPQQLSKYLLLTEIAEFDQETLFRDVDAYLDTYDDLTHELRERIIESEIRPFKEYLVTARTLSADELAVLQYYFLDRKDISLAHLDRKAVENLGQELVNKFIINTMELEECGEIPQVEPDTHTLRF